MEEHYANILSKAQIAFPEVWPEEVKQTLSCDAYVFNMKNHDLMQKCKCEKATLNCTKEIAKMDESSKATIQHISGNDKVKFTCYVINVTTLHHLKANTKERNGNNTTTATPLMKSKDGIQTHHDQLTTTFIPTVDIQDIKMDFIAQQRSLTVIIATKLDTSPITASRNGSITTTQETMNRRIFIISPQLKMMTKMDMHQMIAKKVIPPKFFIKPGHILHWISPNYTDKKVTDYDEQKCSLLIYPSQPKSITNRNTYSISKQILDLRNPS